MDDPISVSLALQSDEREKFSHNLLFGCIKQCAVSAFITKQIRNQLETAEGAKSFLGGAQIF